MIDWTPDPPPTTPTEEAVVDGVELRLVPSEGVGDVWILTARGGVGHTPEVEDDEVRVTRRFQDRPSEYEALVVADAARAAMGALGDEDVLTPAMAALRCYELHARTGRTLTAEELQRLAGPPLVSFNLAAAIVSLYL